MSKYGGAATRRCCWDVELGVGQADLKMSENTPSAEAQTGTIQKVQTLLRAKDDTSRFVGLALLKSVLDNTPELRSDESAISTFWESIPSKFIDRLIRTGSKRSSSGPGTSRDSNDMLDLAVSVLHTFTALLPESAKQNTRLTDRIPQLVACLLHCSNDSTRLALETLVSLVSQPEGARVFIEVEDLSPLTEIAASQPLALDVLLYAWLNAAATATIREGLRAKIDTTVQRLVSSFKGTDAVTLLSFLAALLPRLEPDVLPPNPNWLTPLGKFISNLVTSRPTAAGRAAFTNLSAALLEAYPLQAPHLLFAAQGNNKSDNPSSYLLINLLLVDIRATLPSLLSQLNTPTYPDTARRLTSAFNVLSHFIGYLVRSMDSDLADSSDPASPGLAISPDLLLKLRKAVSETMSLTIEYLRDRWDASVAGAMGLHPDARSGTAVTDAGARSYTLAWDAKSADDAAADGRDPLVLAAVRALAIWLREDENDMLRAEAAGLADMLVDLYRKGDGREGRLEFRRPVLVAWEGIVAGSGGGVEDDDEEEENGGGQGQGMAGGEGEQRGVEAFLQNGGWDALVDDMLAVLEGSSRESNENDAARGIEIVRVLLPIAEAERPGTREVWMDVVTKVAAWYVPDAKQPPVVEEFQVAVLQLVTTLVANAHRGMRKRYVHTTAAVLGIAEQLRRKIRGDAALEEALEDVLRTLAALR
ncbi:hypothetical protein VTK26DRAFT_836 [Humicola hyalothermophila]